MNLQNIKNDLNIKGYCIVSNILDQNEIDTLKNLFYEWKDQIPNHDFLHKNIDPHGIYKFFNVGHTRHAWLIRTNNKVQEIFKSLWNTHELIVSFDGCCYIEKSNNKKDNCWTHTDQAPNCKKFECYQGFISLTDNKERTLVVYEGSHLLHKRYFEDSNDNSSKNWNLISEEYLNTLEDKKKVLNVKAGSLVLWDSRTFHQNQYGKSNSEERLVQYVCYLPKSHPKNTKSMQDKRKNYFINRRTTSHWPCPIRVNSLQPQTYGDNNKKIDYSQIPYTNLDDIENNILKII